ncbi:uracil-DNA glycosylase [Stappia sp.]|uniref:uracil-DNA glycosylase n=1 Tax=Stappia sp. TaxID=1870903 RepID=UPI003D0F7524
MSSSVSLKLPDPGRDCPSCPRLVAFRETHRALSPDWHNAPVLTFAAPRPRLLIVGLAPGLRGANKTGRPFTGDYAGDLLYETLVDFGFARGTYQARPDDGLELVDAAITNAVRCVPPENKPVGAEIRNCLPYLSETIEALPSLVCLVALGRIAHDATLSALAVRRAAHPFGHNARHDPREGLALFDSYHCSRYNTNTGRLTREMFRDVFVAVRAEIDAAT